MNAFELTPKQALEQVVAYLQYQQVEYGRLPPQERKGHIWEAVQVLERELSREVVKKSALEQIKEARVVRKAEGLVQQF
jgi:hypothetical protein